MYLPPKVLLFVSMMGLVVFTGIVLFSIICFEAWYHNLLTVGEKMGCKMDFLKKKKGK